MRSAFLPLWVIVSCLLGTLPAFSAQKPVAHPKPLAQQCFRMGVPAYAYPGLGKQDFWNVLAKRGTIYILNPASGPGQKVDPTYTSMVQSAKTAGIRIWGYVDTNYGKRSIKLILADVDAFKKMYPIDGIFFDQTSLDAEHLPYYRNLSMAMKTRKLPLAFNPGQPIIDERYVPLANYIMTFEGPLSTYLKTSFPDWSSHYPKTKFWHLVYEVPNEKTMKQVIGKASGLPVGMLYITHRGMPNPWDAIPPYWNQEVNALCPESGFSRNSALAR
jgi:hypothetical protein